MLTPELKVALQRGLVIPACPLALNEKRALDERRQRALFRYYAAAGVGAIAVGVHTTQFAIRDPKINLLRPVLELGREEMTRAVPPEAIAKVISFLCSDDAWPITGAAIPVPGRH